MPVCILAYKTVIGYESYIKVFLVPNYLSQLRRLPSQSELNSFFLTF
jgi:hypothetical protein